MSDSTTELDLIRRIAQADEGALRALHQRMSKRIYAMALSRVNNIDDAHEVVAETFVRIWNGAANFDPMRFAPAAWMLGIARHVSLDLVRKREPVHDELDNELHAGAAVMHETPEAIMVARSDLSALQRCMAHLNDHQREALHLHAVDGLALQEVADIMRSNLNTVKTRIFHARKQLQQCLKSAQSVKPALEGAAP